MQFDDGKRITLAFQEAGYYTDRRELLHKAKVHSVPMTVAPSKHAVEAVRDI
jgi:hypothetical protein